MKFKSFLKNFTDPIALVGLLGLMTYSFLGTQTQTFDASGTFNTPHKITTVRVQIWRAGGGFTGKNEGARGGGAYFQIS